MKLRWLVRKELAWGRHQWLALAFVLLVLPGAGAYAALGFQHVLPEDSPVAVVPQDESVTDDDLAIVVGALTAFSDPVTIQSEARAMAALDRERVYAVVTVPPRLADRDRPPATLTLYTHGSVVPYREPARAIANLLRLTLRRALPAPVTVERVEVGHSRTLSEYLLPTLLLLVALLLAFAVLPYELARESVALDRVRVHASVGSIVGARIATFAALSVLPLVTVAAAGRVIGYDVALLSPWTVAAYLLTFVAAATVASAVTVAGGFGTGGRVLNLGLALFVVSFSGLVYPVGFFSVLRRDLVRLVPVHYGAILVRGHALRGLGPGAVLDLYGVLAATVVVAAGLLWLALAADRRRAGA